MNDRVMARTSLFRPPADIRQSNYQVFSSKNLVKNAGLHSHLPREDPLATQDLQRKILEKNKAAPR
ncbi:hypothetical protein DPMN_013281 [Dreissena polymorpha]|uniref:Uncharacterized protein n=1 Tax=Dreissena polymorpha TaxID=45954 RepID=A0A9D4S3J6_DREPO|nr:hypothetical protein DPMN_013281 [Dreissena polymorpha]